MRVAARVAHALLYVLLLALPLNAAKNDPFLSVNP